jgi:hypothetical protein
VGTTFASPTAGGKPTSRTPATGSGRGQLDPNERPHRSQPRVVGRQAPHAHHRRRHYELLGGWEYSFSEVGEPGICADNEFCLRAWMNGYQVGYRFVPFKGPSGHYPADGGTVLFSNETRVRNAVRNSDTIFRTYRRHARQIDRLVEDANAGLRSPPPDGKVAARP